MHKRFYKSNQGRQCREFRADVKSNTAPGILDSYLGDDGEVMLVLDNGNEQPKVSYDAMWNRAKTAMLPKGTK